MSASLPWSLVFVWAAFFCFLIAQERHIERFRGMFVGLLIPLKLSFGVGVLAFLAILIYYFIEVSWYLPLILILISGLLAGVIGGIAALLIGELYISLAGFIGWPICAFLAISIIRTLHS